MNSRSMSSNANRLRRTVCEAEEEGKLLLISCPRS